MFVLLHVVIALGGIVSAAITAITPSIFKFKLTYGLVGLTFASGTYLVISSHSNLRSACASGLIYLAAVFVPLALAHKRFAAESGSL